MLARSLMLTAAVLLAATGFLLASGPSCAWGFRGCGEGTNECRYDCPGTMNCVRSGNPFEMCQCDAMTCVTTMCDDVEA